MKKVIMTLFASLLLLAACNTAEETSNEETTVEENETPATVNEQVEQQEEEISNTDETTQQTTASEQLAVEDVKAVILYESDANAESTMPFEVSYAQADGDFVRFIFEKVNKHDVGLIDYKFENGEQSLVLNLDEGTMNIQGSTGAMMFVETLTKSYFENYSTLQEVTFISEGSYEEILDHMSIGTPYTRADIMN
jgi:hypothetical protein